MSTCSKPPSETIHFAVSIIFQFSIQPCALRTSIAKLEYVLPELFAQMIKCGLALDPIECDCNANWRHAPSATLRWRPDLQNTKISRTSLLQRFISKLIALHNRRKSGLFASKHLMLAGCVPK